MTDFALHQTGARIAADCLARYKAERIDGLDGDMIPYMRGTCVHFCVEAGFVASAAGNEDPYAAAKNALDRWWQENGAKLPPGVYADCQRILATAYGEESSLWLRLPGRGQKVNVEVEWHLDADFKPCDASRAAFSGRWDYVEWGEKGVRVRDWKTSMIRPSNEDVATDVQARIYALAALALFPDAPDVRFSLDMLRHGYAASWTFVRGEPWEEQTRRYLRRMRSVIAWAMDVDEWPETPGDGCGWCARRHKCETLGRLIAQGSLPDDASPEHVARTYLAAKSLASEAERKARKIAEDVNVPIGEGRVLGFKPTTRKSMRPLAFVLEQFDADGVTPEDIAACFDGASITKGGLDKLALRLVARGEIEEPREWVDQFREEEGSVTFTTFEEWGA